MRKRIQILTREQIEQKIKRLAWKLYEDNHKQDEILIVGIAPRGSIIANSLAQHLADISDINVTLGSLQLEKNNPYNNDVKFDLNVDNFSNNVVVLCDDVLNSGKTLMYAAKFFLSSPLTKLSTVVLVDRNHNRYPIKSDYVGLSLATTLHEYINVVLEGDNQGVYLS